MIENLKAREVKCVARGRLEEESTHLLLFNNFDCYLSLAKHPTLSY